MAIKVPALEMLTFYMYLTYSVETKEQLQQKGFTGKILLRNIIARCNDVRFTVGMPEASDDGTG